MNNSPSSCSKPEHISLSDDRQEKHLGESKQPTVLRHGWLEKETFFSTQSKKNSLLS